jgi:membrane-associated protein
MTYFGIDLMEVIRYVGLTGLFLIVFAETGLFLGFFFPGDSLLFVAGILAAQGFFSIGALIAIIFVAAVTGNLAGYWFGAKIGPKLFTRDDSLLFKKRHALKAQAFYDKYGAKTIVLARFIPVVRTFAPIVAGVASMNYRQFFLYNLVGGFLWTVGLVLLGYSFGNYFEERGGVDKYILPVVLAIIFVSILPGIIGYLKERYSVKKTAPDTGFDK